MFEDCLQSLGIFALIIFQAFAGLPFCHFSMNCPGSYRNTGEAAFSSCEALRSHRTSLDAKCQRICDFEERQDGACHPPRCSPQPLVVSGDHQLHAALDVGPEGGAGSENSPGECLPGGRGDHDLVRSSGIAQSLCKDPQAGGVICGRRRMQGTFVTSFCAFGRSPILATSAAMRLGTSCSTMPTFCGSKAPNGS